MGPGWLEEGEFGNFFLFFSLRFLGCVESGSLTLGRCSYADLAWFMWQDTITKFTTKEEYNVDDFPLVKDWIERIGKREAVQKALAAKDN
jgi:glutathione S-transferase